MYPRCIYQCRNYVWISIARCAIWRSSSKRKRGHWNNPCFKSQIPYSFLKFNVIDIQGKRGGPEYYIFKELWKKGGQYITNYKFTGSYTKVTENHAFVYNAKYTGTNGICYGSIVDNQENTHLFGIEKSDVSSVAKARQICNNLFLGATRFTHCFKVTKQQEEVSSSLIESPSKKRKENYKKNRVKKIKNK